MTFKLVYPDSFQTSLPQHRAGLAVTILLLFFYSFPFNSGSHINLLIFTCFLIGFIIYVFFTTRDHPFSLLNQLKIHHPTAYYLLLALFITCSISFFNVLIDDVANKHKLAAALRYFIYCLIVGYVFALTRFCIIFKLSHTVIFFYFTLGVLTLTILQLLTWHFGKPIDAGTWFLHPPFGHHIRDTGDLAAIAAVITVIFLLFLRKSQPLLFSIIVICTLSSWSFLIWTGGRSGIVSALIVSLLILALGFIYVKKEINNLLIIIICIAVSFPLANSLSVFPWNGLKRTTDTITASIEKRIKQEDVSLEAMGNEFSTGRFATWKLSVKAVKQSPLFGLGPNGFYFISDRFYGDHPHNLVIQFLVEWGIIGTSLLLILLSYMAWHGLKKIPTAFKAKDTDYIISASVVLVLTLNALVGGSYFMLQPLFCLVTAFTVFPFARTRNLPPA